MRCRFNFFIIALVLVFFLFVTTYFDTVYGLSGFEPREFVSDRVFVVSDALSIDICSGSSEFEGNVRLVYGDVIFESDYLKVLSYNDSIVDLFGTNTIYGLLAEGNVKIRFDDKIAITDHATYSAISNELILTGSNSSVSCLDGTISGEKFIFLANGKKIFIESGTDTKVIANLLP